MGNTTKSFPNDLPINHTCLGYLDYILLAKAFQSSDVFLCTSIEDSGPMMINQSLMCGIPVVSFKMGVSLDLVKNNITGYLAQLKNCHDLAIGLTQILKLNVVESSNMSSNCIRLSDKLLKSSDFYKKLSILLSQYCK